MKPAPTFEDIFDVLSAASVGDAKARVVLPDEPEIEDLPTRFAIALNILLDDLSTRLAEVRALEEQRFRKQKMESDRTLGVIEQRLRALIDGVQDYAIMMLDPEGHVASWNAGAERQLGYSADEIVGRHFAVFYPPDQLARAELEVATRTGRFEDEGLRVRKDGSHFWANAVVTSVKDADGKIIGFAKVVRDLSERRRAEEALRLANRELEAFSYSVAHDLRTPLRGMNGFAQMLLDTYSDKLDAEGQRWLRSIVNNAEKMGDLIDGLLSLARVTRTELKRQSIDLATIAREVLARLRDDKRAVEVVVPEQLKTFADPRLVRPLLENLLGNAWKFTGKVADPKIEVGTERGSFFVRDNGAGFDMTFAEKLFKPFQRLHATEEFPGTGIGLATAHRVIERHGGRIWAESAPGKGATFYFTLNVSGADSLAPRSSTSR